MSENKPMTVGELIKKLSECDQNIPIRTLHQTAGWSDEEVDVVDIDNQGDSCVLILSDTPTEEDDYY